MTRSRNAGRTASYWLSGLPGRQAEPPAAQPDAVEAKPVADADARPDALRHGYTLRDLHDIARLSVHTAGAMASDWYDRYDTAYSAIAEHLYAIEDWPRRSDLVRAGQLAIYAVVQDDRHHHGYYKHKTLGHTAGAASSPIFLSYWWDWIVANTGSHEGRIVERTALYQIFCTLKPAHQEALIALAVYEDYRAAANALGRPYATYKSLIATARIAFKALWHEGEVPSKPWGVDRRVGSYANANTKPPRVEGGRAAVYQLRRRSSAREVA